MNWTLKINYEFNWNGLNVYAVNGKLEDKNGTIIKYVNTAIVSSLKPDEMYKIDYDEINKGRISSGVYNLIKDSIK